MAQLRLVIGPVGAGKSTLASCLCREHGALRLTLDDWMTRLFRPDRPAEGVMPWYVERAARCVDQIWQVSLGALAIGVDVVLEIGLIRRAEREVFYARVDDAAIGLEVYLVDAPRELRRQRVARRNRERGETFAMEVPPAFFELASDCWEPPEDHEHATRKIIVLTTG
jgi:predicted kinase